MNEIVSKIKSSEDILIISHQHPDGDALGSSLSMFFYIKGLGKKVTIFNVDLVPAPFKFLPGLENITHNEEVLNNEFDLIIILDTGSWNHSRIDQTIIKNACVINIDHHVSNPLYGDINLVNINASSTCEVICKLFTDIGFEINRNIAQCLLAGILDDTGGLVNGATNSESLKMSSELIKKGAKIHKTLDRIEKIKTINSLRLWGDILSRFKSIDDKQIAYMYVREEECQRYNVNDDELNGLTHLFNIISGVRIGILFKINKNETKVSMRTTRDDVDLSSIAKNYGGGGHRKASGFRLPYSLKEESDIIDFLKNITD